MELIYACPTKLMAPETAFQHTSKQLDLVKIYFIITLSFTSAELNQRALVGRTAAVFSIPQVADSTVEQSINETMRYCS